MDANFPSTSSPPEQFWVADTSVTTHMPSDLAHLCVITLFSCTTASGLGLPIYHVETFALETSQCTLQLNEVLHVP